MRFVKSLTLGLQFSDYRFHSLSKFRLALRLTRRTRYATERCERFKRHSRYLRPGRLTLEALTNGLRSSAVLFRGDSNGYPV